ncbi:MAG TPA: radical SAM protein [Sedimentisphaerales bacterium]|nr:radical SAM protein [Sedimentisphaerales bacterium]
MKVLLCTIPLNIGVPRNEGQWPIMPKVAIVSLIKWMESHGYTKTAYDFYDIDMLDPSDDEIRQYFESSKPTVVGLSAVVSTSYSQVKRVAGILRQSCPDAWIVMGGNLAVCANVVLRKTEVDICVQGDGEIPWVEFLDYVRRFSRQWNYEELSKIKSLSYIDEDGEMQFTGYGGCIPASEIPLPDYDLLALGLKGKSELLRNYFRKGAAHDYFRHDPRALQEDRRPMLADFWVSKGCVAKCTFCQRTTKGYRVFSLDAIDEHLQILKDKFNVGFIHLIDENFGSNRKHAREVARLMKEHNMLWACGGVRCTTIVDEDVQFYHDHLCVTLKLGVESGSQRILDVMEKRCTVERAYNAATSCTKRNIHIPFALMIGMPGETDRTVRKTGELVGKIASMSGVHPSKLDVGVFYALPLPGTPLYEYGQQTGLIGATVEQEQEYLESVLDRGAGLLNYINLNGASLRKILYWETLIKLEASRAFHRNRHNGPTRPGSDANERTFLQEAAGLFRRRRLWSTEIVHVVRYRLNRKLMSSRFIARLPRPLVDAVARNLNYLVFLLVKFVSVAGFKIDRMRGRNVRLKYLFRRYRRPSRLAEQDLPLSENHRRWSLRDIVKARAECLADLESVTERNRLILLRGR